MKYENTYMSFLVNRLQEAIETDDLAGIVKFADKIKSHANYIVSVNKYEK